MQVKISGQHIDVGEALNKYIVESLESNVKKYFENAIHANVNVTKDKHNVFTTDIFVNEGTGTGVIIKATGQDSDAHRSVDQCIARIDTQLKRYKERIKRNHKDKSTFLKLAAEATKYIISPFEDDNDENIHNAAPTIVAELNVGVENLTVADAVMRMDLLEVPALMFVNKGNGRVNMVYYRPDGNIAWVDTNCDIIVKKK